MKLTSKGRYAVMALVDLARFDNFNPVSLRDISLRQGISLDYLEQIFSKLKKNEIVKSIRGTQGGYVLNKNPNDIKLTNIFNAVDEKVKTVQCKKESKRGCLDELDPKLLETYKKLGIPLQEQARLNGIAVDAVFDSVSVATTFKEELTKQGIIFCSMSDCLLYTSPSPRDISGSRMPSSA